jgi:hypothetical protein
MQMAKRTRRAVLGSGLAAVGGVSLLSFAAPEVSEAQSNPADVFHIFAFQWKEGTTEAQKDRAKSDILAFQGKVPGLLQTRVGPNISPRGKGYTFGGMMQFKDEASLNAYFDHPAHQALLVWLKPLIDAIELDLRA